MEEEQYYAAAFVENKLPGYAGQQWKLSIDSWNRLIISWGPGTVLQLNYGTFKALLHTLEGHLADETAKGQRVKRLQREAEAEGFELVKKV